MTARLVFAHGWGLDRDLWAAVLTELGPPAEGAALLDAGYYGRPTGAGLLDPGRPLLGVGQSLGALELLVAPPAPLAGLVVLDGFARFSAAPDLPEGQPAGVLRFLARRIRAGAGPVVAEFLERAAAGRGAGAPAGNLDPGRLAEGLERLIAWDGRPAARILPIWRLHASGDPVCPLAHADASFAGADVRARVLREADDHLSPITAPAACAALIRQALAGGAA